MYYIIYGWLNFQCAPETLWIGVASPETLFSMNKWMNTVASIISLGYFVCATKIWILGLFIWPVVGLTNSLWQDDWRNWHKASRTLANDGPSSLDIDGWWYASYCPPCHLCRFQLVSKYISASSFTGKDNKTLFSPDNNTCIQTLYTNVFSSINWAAIYYVSYIVPDSLSLSLSLTHTFTLTNSPSFIIAG